MRRADKFIATGGILAALALGWALHGCGAAVSDSQRTAYIDEERRCDEAQAAIVARTGTTEAQDTADLATLRAQCDANLRAIEPPDGGP